MKPIKPDWVIGLLSSTATAINNAQSAISAGDVQSAKNALEYWTECVLADYVCDLNAAIQSRETSIAALVPALLANAIPPEIHLTQSQAKMFMRDAEKTVREFIES